MPSSIYTEKDWLYNRMQEAKKEVGAWKLWQKEAMGITGNIKEPNISLINKRLKDIPVDDNIDIHNQD